MDTSPMMTLREVAAYLRVCHSTIYRLIGRGGLPYFRVGSDYRFHPGAIDEWRMKQDGTAKRLREPEVAPVRTRKVKRKARKAR